MKRQVLIPGLVLMLLAAAALTLALSRSGDGSSRKIEAWVAQQLREVASKYIEPEIHFDSISYVRPTGIRLTNFRMSGVDSAGTKHDFITAAEVSLELGRIPKPGEPVEIRQLAMTGSTVLLVAMSEDDRRMVGFSKLIKSARYESNSGGASFELRRVRLTGGRLVYNPRIPGAAPMLLDEVDSELLLSESGEGLLSVDLQIDREGLLHMVLRGMLDLQGMALRAADLRLGLSLDRHDRSRLPPQLQVFLDRFGVEGKLNLQVQGDVPLLRSVESEVAIDATLTDGRAIIAGLQPSIDRLDLTARIADGSIDVDQLVATTLGGSVDFAGRVRLDSADLITSGRLTMIDLDLSKLEPMSNSDDGMAGILAGRLVLTDAPINRLTTPGFTPPAEWGRGDLELTGARLIRLPVVSSVLDQLFELMRLQSDPRAGEKISVIFDLTDAGMSFSTIEYAGWMMAGRGSGTMSLGGELNLRVNAGPLEGVQSRLGGPGRAMGRVTDRLGGYRVTGTVDSPQVRPVPPGQ